MEFVFSDESGTKLRPALIISSSVFGRGRSDVIVAAITSNVQRRLVGDFAVVDWQVAGLLFPSTVTGIARTVSRSMIRRRLGSLTKSDLDALDAVLRNSPGL